MPRGGIGLPVKLHAEQLSNLGGAKLAAQHGALSADHLEYLDDDGRRGDGGGRDRRRASARRLLFSEGDAEAAGRGAAPRGRADRGRDRLQSRLLAAHLAASRHEHGGDAFRADGRGMSPRRDAERGTRARDSSPRSGTLEAGKWCDLAVWDVERPAELVYRIGFNPLHRRYRGEGVEDERHRAQARRCAACRLARHLSRRGALRSTRPAGPASAAAAETVAAIVAKGEPVYGINTGFGKLATVRIDAGGPCDAAAQHRALARGGRRRADARAGRAADDGAEAREPGAGRFRRAARNARPPRGDAGAGRHPRRAGAGLGRRVRRPCAARAYDGGDARRRRRLLRGRAACRRQRRSPTAGLTPIDARRRRKGWRS